MPPPSQRQLQRHPASISPFASVFLLSIATGLISFSASRGSLSISEISHHVLEDTRLKLFCSSDAQLLLPLHDLQKSASLLFHVLDGVLQFLVIPVLIFLQNFGEAPSLRHCYASLCLSHYELLSSTFVTRIFRSRQDADRLVLWAEQEEIVASLQVVLH